MSKYSTDRYKKYLSSLAKMFDLEDKNNRYLNMLIGSIGRNRTDVEKIETTEELLHSFSYLVNSLSNMANKTDVPALYIEEQCPDYEKLIKVVTTRLRTQCNEFFKTHADYQKDYDSVEYRKFDFIASLLDNYESAQKELDAMPEDADLSLQIGNVNIVVGNYKTAQKDFNEVSVKFNEFVEDLIFEDLPASLKTKYKDDISSAFVMSGDDPSDEIQSKINAIEDEIKEIEDTYNTAYNDANIIFNAHLRELNTKRDQSVSREEEKYKTETQQLEEEKKTYEKDIADEIDVAFVQENIKCGDNYSDPRFDNVSNEYKNAGSPLPEGASDRLEWTRVKPDDISVYYGGIFDNISASEEKLKSERKDLDLGLAQSQNKLADLKEEMSLKFKGFEAIDEKILDLEYAYPAKVRKGNQEYEEKYFALLKEQGPNDPNLQSILNDYESLLQEEKRLSDELGDLSITALGKADLTTLGKLGFSTEGLKTEDEKIAEDKTQLSNINSSLKGTIRQTSLGKKLFTNINDIQKSFDSMVKLCNENGFELPLQSKDIKRFKDSIASIKGPKEIKNQAEALRLNSIFNNYNVMLDLGRELKKSQSKELQALGEQFARHVSSFNDMKMDRYFAQFQSGLQYFDAQKKQSAKQAEIESKVEQKFNENTQALKENQKRVEDIRKTLWEYHDKKKTTKWALQKKIHGAELQKEEFEKKIAQNTLDTEYLGVSKAYVSSQLTIKSLTAQTEKVQEKLKDVNDRAEKLSKAHEEEKQKIQDEYESKLPEINNAYKEKIAAAELEHAKAKPLREQVERLKKFKSQVKKLFDVKANLKQKAAAVAEHQGNLHIAQRQLKNNMNSQMETLIELMNSKVTETIDRLKGAKKLIGYDSPEYTAMISSLKAYQEGNRKPENKDAFIASVSEARDKIQFYIDKKNEDGKTVRFHTYGQKRMDCAYTLLRLFNQIEDRLGAIDADKKRIDDLEPPKPEITADEAMVLGDSTQKMGHQMKGDEHAAKKPVTIIDRVKAYYKPLADKLTKANEQLGEIFKKGVSDMLQKKSDSFVKSIAAVAVASSLHNEGVKDVSKYNFEELVNKYAKTNAVKDLAESMNIFGDKYDKSYTTEKLLREIGTKAFDDMVRGQITDLQNGKGIDQEKHKEVEINSPFKQS